MRGPRDKRTTKKRPLNVFVENGVLTIEIGADVLAFAALHGSDKECRVNTYVITDSVGLSRDVAREMLNEDEDGSSILTRFLDASINEAIEQGTEHLVPKNELEDK